MRTLQQSAYEVLICADPAELACEAARRFAELAGVFVADNGRFIVALSGGSTPKAMFSVLAEKPYADSLPWARIHFFWGDERCVPPDHAESNYRMAHEALLAKVPVPPENVHRVPAEDTDPQHAAAAYADTIARFFQTAVGDFPRFDLILLGMGADGHTASLFPGTPALRIHDRIVVANFVEKFHAHRISFTAQTINSALNVLFLVAGKDKALALKEVIAGVRNVSQYPSQLIEPNYGTLLWLVDEAAASML
jgi:6-phosphogluconolactonase